MSSNFNFFFKRFLLVILTFFFLEQSAYAIKISPVVLDINKEKKIVFDLPAIASSWLFFGGSSPHGHRELNIRSWPLVMLFMPAIFLLDLLLNSHQRLQYYHRFLLEECRCK